jgi:hypothetical protein
MLVRHQTRFFIRSNASANPAAARRHRPPQIPVADKPSLDARQRELLGMRRGQLRIGAPRGSCGRRFQVLLRGSVMIQAGDRLPGSSRGHRYELRDRRQHPSLHPSSA